MGNSTVVPALSWQPSLWAERKPVVDPSFGGLERTQLDEASGVDHCPGWVSGSDRAFEDLLRDMVWSQRRRWMYDREINERRLTSWRKVDEQSVLAFDWLEVARSLLSDRDNVRFDSMGINLYRDGTDSVAWHRDRIPSRSRIPSSPWCRLASHADSFSALRGAGGRGHSHSGKEIS